MARNNKIKIDKRVKVVKPVSSDRNYPSVSTAPDKKGQDYHKRWAEKIYTLFQSGKTWIPYDIYNKIDEYRSYSDGRQNMDQVKDWVLGKAPKPNDISAFDADGFDVRESSSPENKRKAWTNIDFSPVSVAPKIKTKINEHIRSMYYEMAVKAIDSYSVRNEEHEKYRLWFYKQNRKWIETQMAAVGLQPDEPDFIPENMDELELYASTGGFKVPYSISMEDLLKHTFEVSNWDKEVAERIRDDLFTIGYSMVQEVFDRELKRVVVKYRDVKYSGMQFSNTTGYKDAEWGYTMEFWEISKVRQRLNLSAEQAGALAFGFSDKYGNPAASSWSNYDTIHSTDTGDIHLGCDFYKVPVFCCEFMDIDNEKYIQFEDKFGKILTKQYKGEVQDNEKLKQSQTRYVREAKYIPGTEYVFDYGKKEYIPRDKYKKPRLSYRGVRLMTTPILEQILPFIKGFNLSWIKAQHFMSQAVANGLAIDIGSLKDISIGKDDSFDPMEVLNFYRQSSFLLYKRRVSITGMQRYSSPPVIPIQNNMRDNIVAQFEAMNNYMNLIESTSGISMVSTGKTADPNVAKFNMQITMQGTNDIINGIARGQTDIQEDVSVNVCYRIRSYCRVNQSVADSYAEVIGKNRMKAVVDAEKNHVEYGITIEARDIREQKQFIMTMLQASIAPEGSEGMGMLTPSEAMIIQDMIEQRQNLRRVGLVLGYMLKKKKKEAEAAKQRMIEIQGQQNKELEMIKAQASQQQQQHELNKIRAEFWKDFTIQHGTPPPYEMGQMGNKEELDKNLKQQ